MSPRTTLTVHRMPTLALQAQVVFMHIGSSS